MMRNKVVLGASAILLSLGCRANDEPGTAMDDATGGSDPQATDTRADDDADGDAGEGDDANDGNGDDQSDDPDGDDGSGTKFDIGDASTGDGDGDGDCGDNHDALLEGTVYAPNLELPISGALVYTTSGTVDPIPDEVYCAECVELDCSTPFTLTAADGSFSLPAFSGPGQKLVVQKGQFLRVVELDIATGTTEVPAEQSNLPGEWNPDAGMWIPRIAVYRTFPDAVFNVLAKFGLGEVNASGSLITGRSSSR